MIIKTKYIPAREIEFTDEEKSKIFDFVYMLNDIRLSLVNEDDYLQIRVANQTYNFSRESIQNAYKLASIIYASETAEVVTAHEIETVKES